jgi:uncharacterized SAM-binding protein YcdF (DUF218 family)
MATRQQVVITSAGFGLALVVLGFILFANIVTRAPVLTGPTVAPGGGAAGRVTSRAGAVVGQSGIDGRIGGRLADGIVVLTGGEKRIAEAVRLLDIGQANRLLITGVNVKTTSNDVRRLVAATEPGHSRMFDCCVDIGYKALDTIGNAVEARTWAAQHKFNSLIVVTASNHMPRTMAELRLVLPSTQLIPHAVVPTRMLARPWWLHADVTRELMFEYLKFVPTAIRYGLVRLLRPVRDAAVRSKLL